VIDKKTIEDARQAALGGDQVAVLALTQAVPVILRERDEFRDALIFVLENRDGDGDYAPLDAVEVLRERYPWPSLLEGPSK